MRNFGLVGFVKIEFFLISYRSDGGVSLTPLFTVIALTHSETPQESNETHVT